MMMETKSPLLPMSSHLMREVRYVNRRNGGESRDRVRDRDTASDRWIDDWQLRTSAVWRCIWETRRASDSPVGERWSGKLEELGHSNGQVRQGRSSRSTTAILCSEHAGLQQQCGYTHLGLSAVWRCKKADKSGRIRDTDGIFFF